MIRQREKIIILPRQIYPLRESNYDISIDKTTTPVLLWLEREIIKMMNIVYRYKLDWVE